jgi:hypothetical protein
MRKFPVLIMGCLMASLIVTSPVRAGEEAKDLVAAAPAKKMVVPAMALRSTSTTPVACSSRGC